MQRRNFLSALPALLGSLVLLRKSSPELIQGQSVDLSDCVPGNSGLTEVGVIPAGSWAGPVSDQSFGEMSIVPVGNWQRRDFQWCAGDGISFAGSLHYVEQAELYPSRVDGFSDQVLWLSKNKGGEIVHVVNGGYLLKTL